MAQLKKQISFNIQNEQVVLSNMIKSTPLRKRLSRELKPFNWIGKKHRTAFIILKRMADKNLEFDFDTFETLAKEDEDYGGIAYIRKIESLFEENANINHHVEVLKTDSIKSHIKERRLNKLVDIVDDPFSNVGEIIKFAEEMRAEVRQNFNVTSLLYGDELKQNYLEDYENRKKKSIFIPTGLSALDRWLTEGMALQKTSIWSARPGMGKSTTMGNIALRQSRGIYDTDTNELISEPRKICIAALESGHISYLDIMVSILIKERLTKELIEVSGAMPEQLVGITMDKMIKYSDQLTDDEDELIHWAVDEIFSNDNLVFVNDPFLTLDSLEGILYDNNFSLCIIDLWERLSDIKIDASAISSKLFRTQQIAKSANVHLALVQQIRRSDSKGKVKKPTLEMLKNSGAYEEIADLVVLMHRAKYYDPNLSEDIIEYIIAKQRRGQMNKSVFHEFSGDFGLIGPARRNFIEAEEGSDF